MSPPAPGWRAAPVLGVRDVRAAAEHWRDVLGFHLDPERGVFQGAGDEPGGVYAILTRGGAVVHLQIRRGELPAGPRERIETDIYLYVDDLAALYRELCGRGARVWGPPRVAPHGLLEIRVEDADGHRITFGQAPSGTP